MLSRICATVQPGSRLAWRIITVRGSVSLARRTAQRQPKPDLRRRETTVWFTMAGEYRLHWKPGK
jgi:hypothetical protein